MQGAHLLAYSTGCGGLLSDENSFRPELKTISILLKLLNYAVKDVPRSSETEVGLPFIGC